MGDLVTDDQKKTRKKEEKRIAQKIFIETTR